MGTELDKIGSLVESESIDSALILEAMEPLLQDAKSRPLLRDYCFKALSKAPQEHRLRLTLARLFYTDGMGEHCIRELLHLKKLVGENPALERLLETFREYACTVPGISFDEGLGGSSVVAEMDQEVAELDIDVDFDEALDDLSDEEN